MHYDFQTLPQRRGTGSAKWELMYREQPDLGPDVVPLSVADMEFENPPEVKQALREWLDGAVMGYTDPTDEFFSACLGWQERRHGWTPEREWVVTSPGVVPAIFNAVRTLTSPGDGVIVQPPVYYPFFMAVE
ncbi:MAG: aminotransferase class I/II-fold pyridoxal phosphate-dependent enzyme, partial [Parafannyhessea umbonata]